MRRSPHFGSPSRGRRVARLSAGVGLRGADDHLTVEGPPGGRGTVGDAELDVDVLDVVVGGLRRDEQLLGDLARGRPVSDEPQHLCLAGRQAGDLAAVLAGAVSARRARSIW